MSDIKEIVGRIEAELKKFNMAYVSGDAEAKSAALNALSAATEEYKSAKAAEYKKGMDAAIATDSAMQQVRG